MKTRTEVSPNLIERYIDPINNLNDMPQEERHDFVLGLRDKIDAARGYLGEQNCRNLTRMLLAKAQSFEKKEKQAAQKKAPEKPKRTIIKSDLVKA